MRFGTPMPTAVDPKTPAWLATPHVESTKEEVQRLIRTTPLLVFSKTYCPYSKSAKAILASHSLTSPPTIIEVDLRDDASEVKTALNELTGRNTFPNVFVQGESIGGASEVEAMQEQGLLFDVLAKNNLLVSVEI